MGLLSRHRQLRLGPAVTEAARAIAARASAPGRGRIFTEQILTVDKECADG